MFTHENFGSQRSLKITSIKDERLIKIAPSSKGFFNNVLNFYSEDDLINNFIQAVNEVKDAKLPSFWKPFCDPAFNGKDIVFAKGMTAAVGHSFNWWTDKISQMPVINGRKWVLGTDQHYIAFLVWLINKLVSSGLDIADAIDGVVIDSKKLGAYLNSIDQKFKSSITGTCMVSQCYDLAARIKILKCTNGGFCEASGSSIHKSYEFPLARIEHCTLVDHSSNLSTGWPILLSDRCHSENSFLSWL